MNKKEREQFKRQKIEYLYIYRRLSYNHIAETLNSDPEFVRKCGKIAVSTVAYWVTKKIQPALENNVNYDVLETFNAHFIREIEGWDNEISDISKILENPDLKEDEKIKYMNLRHQIAKDKMILLSDRAVPLAVKKWKKYKHEVMDTLKTVDEEEIPKIEFKTKEDIPDKLKNRIRLEKEDGE